MTTETPINPHNPSPSAHEFTALKLDNKQIAADFSACLTWQDRYRKLIILGNTLPKLAPHLRVEQAQILGCESNTWLYHRIIEGKHYYLADSDSRIIRGFIALLLSVIQEQSATNIKAIDIDAYFSQLGLTEQLSPSRTNGLLALAQAIKKAAVN